MAERKRLSQVKMYKWGTLAVVVLVVLSVVPAAAVGASGGDLTESDDDQLLDSGSLLDGSDDGSSDSTTGSDGSTADTGSGVSTADDDSDVLEAETCVDADGSECEGGDGDELAHADACVTLLGQGLYANLGINDSTVENSQLNQTCPTGADQAGGNETSPVPENPVTGAVSNQSADNESDVLEADACVDADGSNCEGGQDTDVVHAYACLEPVGQDVLADLIVHDGGIHNSSVASQCPTDGSDGDDGSDGSDGDDGGDGSDGSDGSDGDDADDGSDGGDGSDGSGDSDGGDGSDAGDGSDGGEGSDGGVDDVENVTVVDSTIEPGTVGVGDPVYGNATVENTGDDGTATVDVRMTVDGETVATQTVEIPAGETRTVSLVHVFDAAGEHEVAVERGVQRTVTVTDQAATSTPLEGSTLLGSSFGGSWVYLLLLAVAAVALISGIRILRE